MILPKRILFWTLYIFGLFWLILTTWDSPKSSANNLFRTGVQLNNKLFFLGLDCFKVDSYLL